ncbi:hypothetical protein GGF39_003176 [Coemansia sp. RSA 1721]|nr:hypothetical protein GGF39_003176 [Coemansia sp. RSA 1721]
MATEETISFARHSNTPSLAGTAKAQVVDLANSPGTEATALSDGLVDVLRNNEEYLLMYRAIEALKSQLDRAKNDMEILGRLRDRVLADPQEYVQALVSGKEPAAPSQQEVVDVPMINMEPYVLFAHPAISEPYIRNIRKQSTGRGLLATYSGALNKPAAAATGMPANIGAAGLRNPGAGRNASVAGKAGKYTLRQHQSASPSAVLPGPLTGNTAVATPEQSPPRTQSTTAHLTGINNISGTPSTAVDANHPITAASRIRASTSGRSEQSSSVPPIGRSNTEPVHRNVNATAQSVPGTPNSRGRSQKTLTPQILEEFRRQVSEERTSSSERGTGVPASGEHKETGVGQDGVGGEHEDEDNDDDEYYNRLVESAVSEHSSQMNNSYSSCKQSDRSVSQKGAGKSLLLSGIGTSAEYLQPQQHVGTRYMVDHYETDLDDFMESDQERQVQKFKSQNAQDSAQRKRGRPKKGMAVQQTHGRQRAPRRSTNADPSKPKPASYNMPWSDEEQERLEQLLLEYPEEEVANSRWRKISDALGTRNMRQVASRVQKYFIKLAKAGLPVPGRVPNTENWTSVGKARSTTPSRPGRHDGGATSSSAAVAGGKKTGRGKKRKYVDFTSSSGESSGDEDIEIDLDEDESGPSGQAFGVAVPYDRKGKQVDRSAGPALDPAGDFHGITDDGYPEATIVDSDRLFNPASGSSSSKQQSLALRSAKAVHLGYRCDSCLAEPIVGIRWHCMECRGAHTVDLCDECREEGVFETERHNTSHTFHAVREAEMEPYYANEVASSAFQEYAYLA